MTDFIDKIINDDESEKVGTLKLVGVYLEPDLAELLDRLGKKGGRGAKSAIVNEALKKLFIDKGLI